MSYCDYFDTISAMMDKVRREDAQQIHDAACLVCDTVMGGGIVQAFGSGHSRKGAMEISRRAGGLVPVKCLDEPSQGRYEKVEGVGTEYMRECDVRAQDAFVLISNTGINPMVIEIAECAKKRGCKIIAVTALEVSCAMKSKHSSGKKLYELADVVLDTKSVYGDAAMSVEGVPGKVCGTSSIICDLLLNGMMLEAIELMVERRFEPPIFMSGNVPGGVEQGERMIKKYHDRLLRNHIYY